MSTQLKTRPPESRTVEAPAEPVERTVQPPLKASEPRRMTDWYVVIAAIVVVAFSLIAINMLSDDTVSSPPGYVPAFDSPGGNSLILPAGGVDAYVPVFDSPGGNSLNISAINTVAYVPVFDSPGGNSLNTQVAVVYLLAFEGPGGNSLIIP